MSYSNTVTKEDLTNVLNEVLPIYNSTGFTVESITASSATTVSANGGTAWIQVRIPSDKDPVCVVGYYLYGGSGCSVYNQTLGYDSNGYYASFALRNGQSSANNVTITALVLCKQQLTHFNQASADYIVEQGADGNWTYRKWNSGVAECWAGYTINSFAPTSSFGGVYYRILDTTFPTGLFNDTPSYAEVNTYWDTGSSWASARAVTKDTIQYEVFKNSNSSASATMRMYAKGTWK